MIWSLNFYTKTNCKSHRAALIKLLLTKPVDKPLIRAQTLRHYWFYYTAIFFNQLSTFHKHLLWNCLNFIPGTVHWGLLHVTVFKKIIGAGRNSPMIEKDVGQQNGHKQIRNKEVPMIESPTPAAALIIKNSLLVIFAIGNLWFNSCVKLSNYIW